MFNHSNKSANTDEFKVNTTIFSISIFSSYTVTILLLTVHFHYTNSIHTHLTARLIKTFFRHILAFDNVTADEMAKIVTKAPSKHCCLDPAPTWLVKRLLPLLANTLATICNATFQEGVFPANLNAAVV